MIGWLVMLASLGCDAYAQAPLEVTAASSQHSLAPHTGYYHDLAGKDDLAASTRKLSAGAFKPLPGQSASFGFQDGAFWFHAQVVNRDSPDDQWLLVQEYALSDRIDLYAMYADGRVVHSEGGDHLPFSQRNIRYRHPNFWVALPQGQTVNLLVRVQSESSMQVPLRLHTPSAFIEQSRDAQFAIGLYYGILLALFTYNLVLWLTLRDASYFWYLFHITAFGLVLFTLNGLGFEYLWPDSWWLADHMVPLSICLALIGMQQFARIFLELKQRWRFGDRVALAIRLRLELADKEAVRRGSTLFALPQHAAEGTRLIWATADAIWTALGDSSRDVNWYSKRASLCAVHAAAVLFWLGDTSDDHAATREFVDRRIDNILQVEKLKAGLRKNPAMQALMKGPLKILERISAPQPATDLPGKMKG